MINSEEQQASIDRYLEIKDTIEDVLNTAYGDDPRHAMLAIVAARKIHYGTPIPWALVKHFGRAEIDGS